MIPKKVLPVVNAKPGSKRVWRSSSLYTWQRTGCAATLIFDRQGLPQNLQLYAVGEVAHVLLETAARWCAEDELLFGDALTSRLTALSFTFLDQMPAWETEPKPPVGPEQAAEGLKLALSWIARNGEPEGQAELGLAVASDLKTPVDYDSPEARWKGLVDNTVRFNDFDEWTSKDLVVVQVDDYKTSWADVEAVTLQRKGQAILVASHMDQLPDRLILRTLNLRRGKDFVFQTDDVEADIGRWRAELSAVLDQADAALDHHSVESAARPGPSCLSCPYLAHCKPGMGFAEQSMSDPRLPTDASVVTWGTSGALSATLLKALIGAVDRAGGLLDGKEYTVRRGTRKRRVLSDKIAADLWKKWFTGLGDAEAVVPGLLARLGLRVSNLESLIKTMPPEERGPWREWLQKRLTVETIPHGLQVDRKEETQ